MIKSLTIKGYRSLKDVTIELRPLNVMIGPNAGGKTNIMDVLALLQEGAQGHLSDAIARRGGIRSILHAGGSEAIDIRLDIPVSKSIGEHLELGAANTLSYEVVLAAARDGYRVMSEHIHGHDIRSLVRSVRGFAARLAASRTESGLAPPAPDTNPSELLVSQPQALPRGKVLNRARVVSLVLGDFISVHRLPDTRPEAPMRQPQVVRPETELSPDSSNLASLLNLLRDSDNYRADYEAILGELRAGFPRDFVDLSFPPAHGDGTIMMRWREKAFPERSFDSYEISDGTINFIRLATLIESSNPGSVICIDEPEVGLHPRLIRLVREMLQAAAKSRVLIVATHSPTLVDGLEPENVLVVEKVDGVTQVERLKEEDLKHWLDKFSLGEVWQTGQLEKTV